MEHRDRRQIFLTLHNNFCTCRWSHDCERVQWPTTFQDSMVEWYDVSLCKIALEINKYKCWSPLIEGEAGQFFGLINNDVFHIYLHWWIFVQSAELHLKDFSPEPINNVTVIQYRKENCFNHSNFMWKLESMIYFCGENLILLVFIRAGLGLGDNYTVVNKTDF